MARKHTIDDRDRDSFARAVEGTRPLRGRKEYVDPVRKPALSNKQGSKRDDKDEPLPAFGVRRNPRSPTSPTRGRPSSLAFDDMPQNSGIPKKTMRQLANGKLIHRSRSGVIPDDSTIDLHGMTLDEAARRLERFLDDSMRRGRRCVLAIHGKGHGSPDNRTTIKANIGTWLNRHPAVLARHFAIPRDGGTGASYVLLRTSTPDR